MEWFVGGLVLVALAMVFAWRVVAISAPDAKAPDAEEMGSLVDELAKERDELKAEVARLHESGRIPMPYAWRDLLYRELQDGFMRYQHSVDHPLIPSSKHNPPDRVTLYQTSPQFRSKVDNLTRGVMQILDKHLAKLEQEQ